MSKYNKLFVKTIYLSTNQNSATTQEKAQYSLFTKRLYTRPIQY
jgi:hypothetical protein